MPHYIDTLKNAILREVGTASSTPLAGLKIVVNPGNGAGCFFNDLLRDLGADVNNSLHLTPDGNFPQSSGVPNPEKKAMEMKPWRRGIPAMPILVFCLTLMTIVRAVCFHAISMTMVSSLTMSL